MSVRVRVRRVQRALEARRRAPLVASVLELSDCPPWAERLDEKRVVRLIGDASAAERRRLLASWRKTPEQPPEGIIVLPARPAAASFIAQVVAGPAREVLCVGARGDRKTTSGAIATLLHADLHREAGYPLPTTWLAVTGTLAEHKQKLCRTLAAPWWGGIWSVRDEWRLAVATIGGEEVVHLMLMGLEDEGAANRVRTEAHGLWFEEPAPALVMGTTAGLSMDAWNLAQTSLRLPSHHRPAFITENYPDALDWTWQRFAVKRHPGTALVRIPPGESASEEDRALWREALQDRPDLLKRLLDGEPGVIAEGPQVAQGYRSDLHLARERLRPSPNVPLLVGMDGGLTPSATLAQYVGGGLRVLAALAVERGGTRQLCEDYIRPWLASNAPWALGYSGALRHYVDPSLDVPDQSNIEASPTRVIRAVLPGELVLGPKEWPARRDPLLALLGKLDRMTGRPALQLDPEDAVLLDRALSGQWHYGLVRGQVSREMPVKNHPWSDLADSLTYIVAGVAPEEQPLVAREIPVETSFSLGGKPFGLRF